MTDIALETPRLADRDTVAARILRVAVRGPVNIVLAALGLLWLVPTLGLFLTSLLPAEAFTVKGWWQIFSKPSVATWSNYSNVIHNHSITHSLTTTAEIAVGNTLIVIVVGALAGYAFAWLEFPGRVGIFQFLWTWNDLIVALTFGQNVQPITVAIFSNLRQFGANIDLIAPASFISLIVPLAVFFAFQRYFVQGLLAGSVK